MRATLLLLLGCHHGAASARATASCGTYATVGQPILLAECTSCHTSSSYGDARHGAPENIDLDTLAGVQASIADVSSQVSAGTMPPGGGLSADDASRLLAWLGCGAPGVENTLPTGSANTSLLQGRQTTVEVETDADDSAFVDLTTTLVGGDADGRTGDWSLERYKVTGRQGWLQARIAYGADGTESLVETWDPPILLYDEDQTSWTADVNVTRDIPDDEESGTQSWSATVGPWTGLDPRVTDQDASQVSLVRTSDSADGGGVDALAFAMSPDLSLVERWAEIIDSSGVASWEDQMQLTVAYSFEDLPAFPLEADTDWNGRLLVTEAGQ